MLGDLQSPYPIDMLANAWLMGISQRESRLHSAIFKQA